METLAEKMHRELLYTSLVNLGGYYALDTCLDTGAIEQTLKKYEQHWHPYNPRKSHIQRWGMSLTSLDGKMSGIPDLDSLGEYNKQNGTSYTEVDFRTPTPLLLENEIIRKPIEPYIPFLGRSHFIRLGEGGYFPFHRDSQHIGADTFRLFVPLLGCESGQFCFLYDRTRIFLESGQIYFINTKVDHALVSFGKSATMMVLNVILTEPSVRCVIDHLHSR